MKYLVRYQVQFDIEVEVPDNVSSAERQEIIVDKMDDLPIPKPGDDYSSYVDGSFKIVLTEKIKDD